MIKYLKKMQKICIEVKENNIYRGDNPYLEQFMTSSDALRAASNEGTCPANNKCPLYQYCATGRSYGMLKGSYGRMDHLLDEPSIVPWTAEHMMEIADIVNDYAFKNADRDGKK